MAKNLVFLLQSSFTHGGAFKSFYTFIKHSALREKEHIYIYCFNPNQELTKTLESIPGIQLRVFDEIILGQWGRFLDAWPIGGYRTSITKLIKDVLTLRQSFYMYRQLLNDRPTLIYANSSIFRPLLAILNLSGFRNVVKICHLRERGWFGCGFLRKIVNLVFEKIVCVTYISITNNIKNHVEKISKNQIFIIYNPIVINHAVQTKPVNDHILNLLFLGGFQSNKGLYEFLSLFVQYPKNFKVEVRIAGGDGSADYRFSCERLINKISKTHDITFKYLGAVGNISEEITNTDYVIIWHTFPHFSRCIVEAQLLKTKVFTKKDPVISEQININPSGIFLYESLPNGTVFLEYLNVKKSDHIILDNDLENFFSAQKNAKEIDKVIIDKLNLN